MARLKELLITLLLAAVAATCVFAWHERRELDAASLTARREALLSSENDSLRAALADAQQQASDARNILRRSEIERQVSEIRELKFTRPVVYEPLDRAGIRQVVAGKLSEQYTDQEIRDMSTGYSALGLLPPDFPLKQTYINLLGEQIAAFYDQFQHKLFMFRDASLDNAQNRVILAHELTHALQDQNFGLQNLALQVKNNDDEAAAASALIEGDATLVMSQYMASNLSLETLSDTVSNSVTQSMEQIRRAPRYMREMLVFPYLKGQAFCAAVFGQGGYAALSAVYAHPPTSTAQILHPEKYLAQPREDPVPVEFAGTTFRGARPLADNVLGEMGCRILFSQYIDEDSANKIAAGWRGDRYLVFDHGKALVWKTIWDSPESAVAAAAAFRPLCDRRKSAEPGTEFQIIHNEIVFILAPDPQSAQLLYNQFAGAAHG